MFYIHWAMVPNKILGIAFTAVVIWQKPLNLELEHFDFYPIFRVWLDAFISCVARTLLWKAFDCWAFHDKFPAAVK